MSGFSVRWKAGARHCVRPAKYIPVRSGSSLAQGNARRKAARICSCVLHTPHHFAANAAAESLIGGRSARYAVILSTIASMQSAAATTTLARVPASSLSAFKNATPIRSVFRTRTASMDGARRTSL